MTGVARHRWKDTLFSAIIFLLLLQASYTPGVSGGNLAETTTTVEVHLPVVMNVFPFAEHNSLYPQAFDKCNAASVAQMQTWWNFSPYTGTNIYIGGNSRACSNILLTADWVSQVSQQGWLFIPTWVGPQAPCTKFKNRFDSDPAKAYQEGRQEATAAYNAVIGLGFSGEKTVYYNMEAYPTNKDIPEINECHEAVKSFLRGWVERLQELGVIAGVYGISRNALDWAYINPSPEYVWLAYWKTPYEYDPNATVWNLLGLPNSYWSDQQRIRQYTGGHDETWGGVTFNIDSNAVDSPLTSLSQGLILANNPKSGSATTATAQPSIQDMTLLTSETGWALVNERLLWTREGGNHWDDITPGLASPSQVLGVFFQDDSRGWLVARSGPVGQLTLESTTDGGQNWGTSSLDAYVEEPDMIRSAQIQFIDQHTGWIAFKLKTGINFSLGTMLSSVDGGNTWAEHSLPVGGEIHFSDAYRGWLVGGATGEELYATSDGGVTWSPLAFTQSLEDFRAQVMGHSNELQDTALLPEGALKVEFADAHTGWAWVQQGECTGAKPQPGESPAASDEPFQCSLRSILYMTEDGGQSWQEIIPGE